MSNLFGIEERKKPERVKITLKQLMQDRYTNVDLVNALNDYLIGRRQTNCYPSKISFERQLDILDERFKNDNQKIAQINMATLRGWRQFVFEDTKAKVQDSVTRRKEIKLVNYEEEY